MLRLFFVISLISIAGWQGWKEVKAQGADWLPIKHVRIEGAFQRIAKGTIKQVLKKQLTSGLYNADIKDIQASVKSLPWVDVVGVKRVWPDALEIKIIEQIPVVRWKDDGLMNKNGETFSPENRYEFGHLPLFACPVGNELEILEVMKQVTIDLNMHNLILTEFKVSDRRAWQIKLQNNIELILGRKEPLNKLHRFLTTLSLLGEEQIKKIAAVDLRYPNGYTLMWKHDAEEIDWKAIADMQKI